MTAAEVIQFIKDEGVQVVDLKFVDLPGLWQHFSVSAQEFADDAFTEGVGFDGSSIRGFQDINESDMLLFPDPTTAFVDPFTNVKTLSLICDVRDPIDGAD
jgi:glutamine synthetase